MKVIIYLLLCIIAVGIISASAQGTDNRVDSKIMAALDQDSEVSVIVVLKEQEPAKGFGIASSHATRASVLSHAPNFKLKRNYNIINGFSGTVDESALDELRNDPRIQGVYLDEVKEISLTESRPLIKANEVWPLMYNSSNMTGDGQTVCVLDTGIDLNHSDFGGAYGIKVIAGYNTTTGTDCGTDTGACMDDNSHGTHVAGIIAADSAIKGVAPDAKLASIKVCNSSGHCAGSEIIEGIDWCVYNASKFNISVISISIGGGAYSEYCDADQGSYATAIDAAVANNISVVIASGNQNLTTQINSPACIQNAISVGSTDDGSGGTTADDVSYFTNYYPYLDIMAPGDWITSSYLGGGTTGKSGTSMATPHVSAAVALMQEYKKKQFNSTYTIAEIKSILKTTGVNVTADNTTVKTNFSRIDLFNLLDYLDGIGPNITFIEKTPGNNTNTSGSSFIVNITADEIISAAVLEWTNGSVTNYSMSQHPSGNYWYINHSFPYQSTFSYRVFANDTFNNTAVSETRLITYDTTIVTINYTSPTELSNVTLNRDWLFVNVSFVTSNNDTAIINLNGVNYTPNMGTGHFYYNFTSVGNEINSYFAWMNNSMGGEDITETINITIDTVPPAVSLVLPANDSWDTDGTVFFNFSTSDNNSDTCKLYTDITGEWEVNLTIPNVVSGQAYMRNVSLDDGPSEWNVWCNDSAGNTNFSTNNYTIKVVSSAPAVTFWSPDDDTWNSSRTIDFQYGLSGSYLDTCLLYTNITGDWQVNATNITGLTGNFSVEFSSDGHFAWNIMCNNTAGSMSSNITNLTVKIDTVIPSISLSGPADNSWNNTGTVLFSFTVSENNTDTCELYTNQTGTWSPNISQSNIVNGQSHYLNASFTDGDYAWNVRCNDSIGLYNFSDANYTVRIDTVSPAVELVSPANDSWNNSQTIQFNYLATDSFLSTCAIYTNMTGDWEINATNESMVSGTLMNFTVDFSESSFTWNVWCNDSAGNTAFNASNFTTNIDISPPYINISTPVYMQNISSTTVWINGTCSDAGIGVNTTWANDTSWAEFATGATWAFVNLSSDKLSEGIHTVNITCNDSLGNINQSTATFNIDLSYTSTNASLMTINDSDADGNIEFSWINDASEDAETYRIYRYSSDINSSSIGNATLIATGIEEDVEFFEDNNTMSGTEYYYALVTVDNSELYNLSFVSNSLNATPNDAIIPLSPTAVGVSGSGATATITWKNITLDTEGNADFNGVIYQIWISTSVNNSKTYVNQTFTFLKNVTSNSTTHSVTSSGTYYFAVSTSDDAGNLNLSLNISNYGSTALTYTAPEEETPPASSSGGGGGGGGGGTALASESVSVTSISEGSSESFEYSKSVDLAVSEIVIVATNSVEKPKITVSESKLGSGMEPAVSGSSGKTYKYLSITKQNMKNEDIDSAKIKFQVNKSWISDNDLDVDTVALKRYANRTWNKLPTKKLSSDSDFYYFEADSPGFSLFSVTADKKKNETVEETVAPVAVCGDGVCDPSENSDNCIADCPKQEEAKIEQIADSSEQIKAAEPKGDLNIFVIIVLVVLIIIAFSLTITYVLYRKNS
ncbi:MAG: S8 family serine peptidase [bacterium]|nr:S8 family serine peptidase [bacterium]